MKRMNRCMDATAAQAVDWIPAIDIVEHPDRFELIADLPGVSPEHIDISLDGQLLAVSGQRLAPSQSGKRHHGERLQGRFSRQFTLPSVVDSEAIEARTQNGTLSLRIPKLPEVQPRRIEINAA